MKLDNKAYIKMTGVKNLRKYAVIESSVIAMDLRSLTEHISEGARLFMHSSF